MSVTWLTKEERQKFVSYLKQQITSNQELIKGIEASPNMIGPAIEQITKRWKTHNAAYGIVAAIIESIEDDEI
jgi:hypothetical protein